MLFLVGFAATFGASLVACSALVVKAKMFQALNREGVDVAKGFLPTVFEGTADTVHPWSLGTRNQTGPKFFYLSDYVDEFTRELPR